MTEAAAPSSGKPSPRWLRALQSLGDRKMLAMLLLALAAGLPYGAILGTLNAWLTEEGITPSEIGILSFIILAYSYKFIWSPAFQKAWFPRVGLPFLSGLGPRRAWLASLEILIAILLALLALSQPATAIGQVALIGVLAAAASATHDIVLDAWRIEVADSEEDKDLMSALYQFGYRIAGLLSGAIALVVAQRMGWPFTYGMLAVAMVFATIGVFIAPEPDHAARQREGDDTRPTFANAFTENERNIAIGLVAAGWAIAITMIVYFATTSLVSDNPPSAALFTREQGPVIVFLSIIAPGLIAAYLLRRNPVESTHAPASGGRVSKIVDTLFHTILDPLMDLVKRFRWGALLIMALILSYRFVDLIWGSFAYPFYMGENFGALGHTPDDVALASKTIGVIMIMIGSALGAVALLFIGRMPCLLLGGFLAAITNLIFADLAAGGQDMDAFLAFTRLDIVIGGFSQWIAGVFNLPFDAENNHRLIRLIAGIAGENLAVGFASVALVAYLTSIANPKFAAVQYALFASLSMLIGSLGRAEIGRLVESIGFREVFILTAWIGMIGVALTAAEWARQVFAKQKPELERAESPAE